MSQPIRTFIAVELNDALHRQLAGVQAKLAHKCPAHSVRWVEPANIHITLKFLGDVNSDRLPLLERALAEACVGTPPFSLTLAGLGAFPNTRTPNVIWVGARGQIEIVTRLAQKIDDACAALGFDREARTFAPHLTLARVKRDATTSERTALSAALAENVDALGVLDVKHISVMKSELRPSGSAYTRLFEIELKDDTPRSR